MRKRVLNARQVAALFAIFGVDLAQRTHHIRELGELQKAIDAAKVDAKKQFKKLAFKWHPDRNDGDDKEFKRIAEAWQIVERICPAPPPRPRPVHSITITYGGSTDTTATTSTTTQGWPPWASTT